MSVDYELIVEEDLERGHGTVQRKMPAGGIAVGTKISLASFQESVGELFAALPAAAVGKGSFRVVRDSTTSTFGATVAGGGANFVLAWSNGVNWKVVMG